MDIPTTPINAFGEHGTFFNAFCVDESGAVQWIGTFSGPEALEDAVDIANDYARTHTAMCWVSPAVYKFDCREDN